MRKLMSLSHCQELGQLADLASDWLFPLVQEPIRSQLALLTQLLTMATNHKFPSLGYCAPDRPAYPFHLEENKVFYDTNKYINNIYMYTYNYI